MDVYIMRHADAVDGGAGGDFARVLSDKGRKQAEKAGNWLKKQLVAGTPLVVTSPYPRAHETAKLVAESLGNGTRVIPDERLVCGMAPETGSALMYEFAKGGGSLLLVGHAPDLGLLISYLLGAKDQVVEMRKGSLALLAAARAGFGGSVLQWLVHPKLID